MQTSIINPLDRTKMPMLNAYGYDQLNRLNKSRSYENGLNGNTWNPTSYGNEYFNAFTYDAMGNILTQERHNRAGEIFDDLQYHYQKDTNGKLLRNRLYHVNDDPALASIMEDDIEDMGAFISAVNQISTSNNYSYDAEGRLVKDHQEEIDTIIWTATGKVKEIHRSLASTKKNLTFDYDAFGNRIAKHVYDNQTLMLEKSTYYILDASGNQLSMYEHIVDDADVNYYLTERNIYGSSRLGTVKDPVNMMNANPLPSYGILGNRHYELSNHLGNVLTVISDIKYPLSSDNSTIDSYEVGISNIFDYSPFGAPLDGRTVEKEMYSSIEVCSDSVVIDTNYHISCDFQNGHCGWDAQNCLLSISYDLGTGEAKLRLPKCKKRIGFLPPYSYVPQDNMIYHSLETTDGTTYFYEFDFNIGSCINIDSIIFFEGENFNYIHHLTSSGHFTGSFTVATSGTSKVGFYLAGGTEDCFSTLDNFKIYTLDTNIIQNCVTELVASRYVYGYNTQEKVDEIAGAGNHYTAPYWEYDPRVVHRWNRDPKPVPSISPYAINQGNPIWFSDPLGDTVKVEGSKKDIRTFIRQLNRTTGNKYGVDDNGILYNKKDSYNKETTKLKSGILSEITEGIITHEETFVFKLTSNSQEAYFDNYDTGEFDVKEFKKSDRIFQAGQFAHIFMERMANSPDYSRENRTDENYKEAHNWGMIAEGAVVTSMLNIKFAYPQTTTHKNQYTDNYGNAIPTFWEVTKYGDVIYGGYRTPIHLGQGLFQAGFNLKGKMKRRK